MLTGIPKTSRGQEEVRKIYMNPKLCSHFPFEHTRQVQWRNLAGVPAVTSDMSNPGQVSSPLRLSCTYKQSGHWDLLQLIVS